MNVSYSASLRFALLVGLVSTMAQPQSGRGQPAIGSPAPPWQLTDVNGNIVSSTNFLGKVVILNFWQGPACEGCATELPGLEDLYSRYRSKGLEIVGVAVSMDAATARGWMNTYGINYTVVLSTPQVLQDYDVQFTPITYIIDRGNIVNAYHFGITQEAVLESEIQPLLSGPPLGIQLTATDASLWWPTSSVSFVLETCPGSTLGSTAWQTVTNSVVLSGTNATVTLPRAPGSWFFRLRKS